MKKALCLLLSVCMIMSVLSTMITASAAQVDDSIVSATYGDYTYFTVNEQNICITGYIGKETHVVVPSVLNGLNVVGIGDSAFSNCDDIVSVELPQSITYIGTYAFCGCSNLENINIPEQIKTLDMCVFAGCSSLKEIEIPQGVTSISEGAFEGCSSLDNIVLPESLESIGDSCFKDCTLLSEIVIPKNACIGLYVFSGCNNLAKIVIENPTCSIWEASIPKTTSIYGYMDSRVEAEALEGGYTFCYIGEKTYGDFTYVENSDGNVVVLSYIGDDAQVVIPSEIDGHTVVRIKDKAFYNCSLLTSVELPDTLQIIGANAFNGCYSLQSIDIPSSVESIGEKAFWNCRDLEIISIKNPDCVIYDDYKTLSGAARIYAYKNSTSHLYARNYNRGLLYFVDELVPLGDTNGDTVVSIIDATEVQRHLAGLSATSGTNLVPKGAQVSIDTDADGRISILDATQIQLYLAELIPEL